MQKVWNVFQALLVTGASIGIVSLAVNQSITPKPVIVTASKPVSDDQSAKQAEPVNQESRKTQTIDIPLPPGRVSGITQNVVISGGRIVSATVTVEQ